MEDSEPAEDGLLAGLRWNRSARDQAQLKHKIRDLPGLLKHGLHLRKKSVSTSNRPLSDCPSFRVWCLVKGGRVLFFFNSPDISPWRLWSRFVSLSRLRCLYFAVNSAVAEAPSVCTCVRARAYARYIHNNQNCCWTPYLHTLVVKATPPPLYWLDTPTYIH